MGRTEHISEFVNVDSFKKLRVATLSDVILQVQVEWSHNGEEPRNGARHLINSYRTPSDMWKVEVLPTSLPFCRIKILNSSGHNNDVLHAIVYGIPYHCTPEHPPYSPRVPYGSGLEPERIPEKKKRAFSIGRSKNQSPGPNRVVEGAGMVDYRLPGFVPKGSLFVGDKNGKVKSLPRGVPGEYLMVNADGEISWMLPYPPRN